MCPAAVENYSRIRCLFLKKRVYKRLMRTKKFYLASVPLLELELNLSLYLSQKKPGGSTCV